MTERVDAVVIGASAGAVQGLLSILPSLPADYPVPVIVVVHVPAGPENALAALLRDRCRMSVKEAEDKEPVAPGVVYLAPSDYHLLVETEGAFSLSSDEPVHYARPSIDVLFESAADAWSEGLVGVILSGANEDGAAGLARILAQGGVGLVEEPDDAYASAMPLAALAAAPSARRMTLAEIRDCLQEIGRI